MIELHLCDGNPVAVSPVGIFYCQPADDGTLIMSIGGSCIVVTEDYFKVQKRLKRWTKE